MGKCIFYFYRDILAFQYYSIVLATIIFSYLLSSICITVVIEMGVINFSYIRL